MAPIHGSRDGILVAPSSPIQLHRLRRKFAEGKSEIYCIVIILILYLFGAALTGGGYLFLKHGFENRHPVYRSHPPSAFLFPQQVGIPATSRRWLGR